MPTYKPDDILDLTEPTDRFLCPLSANTYGINFQSFNICDYETKDLIFEVGGETDTREAPAVQIDYAN